MSRRVYPRVYGGTLEAKIMDKLSAGLSPRVRGNHAGQLPLHLDYGSIPACTGEPQLSQETLAGRQVYPRVYGGTVIINGKALKGDGLSPRVRGNRSARCCGSGPLGSIPACTGEPGRQPGRICGQAVYPRVYGGTANSRCSPTCRVGLSPRVRGNPLLPGVVDGPLRSIPACTGEPTGVGSDSRSLGVYPRVYGGTEMMLCRFRHGQGLSPRVRGNHHLLADLYDAKGSIPACTGEPDLAHKADDERKVYPRVYGGTTQNVSERMAEQGLSPRVRGNPEEGRPLKALSRSIPACTGEPLLILLHFLPMRAYCALQRDAIQIVKELFVPGRTGSFRENDALLIHQLNGRRPQDSNDLAARMTRVLPCHDDGPSPKLQEPFRDHRPDPFSDTGGEFWRGVYPRSNLQHARGKKATDSRGHITRHYYRHRRQSAALSCRSFSR